MPKNAKPLEQMTAGAGSTATVRPDLVLAICCLSLVLAGMDVTIVNVALPAIQHALRADVSGLQWVVDAYTLVVASLLMLSGAMSDRYGRRRVFQIGLVVFCLGSLLCSVAANLGQLIFFRAVQGIGASMLNPVALSIIANVFPVTRDRARAVGVWGAVGGLALALGPLLGGVLTQTVGWRSIFWVNLPVGIAAIVLTARFVPESRAPRARAVDTVGQSLIFVFLASILYAVIEGPRLGWDAPRIMGLFVLSGSAAAAFIVYEPRHPEPLLDLRFFRSIPFTAATVLGVSVFASFAGFLFLNALYLEQVRGYSAFKTGLCTLPLALGMTLSAPVAGHLIGRRGTRAPLLAAGSALFVSALLLTNLDHATPLAMLLFAYALFGTGLGLSNPAIANNAVAGMPLSQAGVAAAIASTSRQVGASFGVAVAGTVVAASRAHGADFARATHPVWWLISSAGLIVFLSGWLSNTAWGRNSTQRVAHLYAPGELEAARTA